MRAGVKPRQMPEVNAFLTPRNRPLTPRRSDRRDDGGETMIDLLFLSLLVAFFAISSAYARGCESL